MSTNNCCCGVIDPPPGPTLSPELPCMNNYTIMSQTGLITDINCGIRPVEGEIFGLQMQSTSYDSFVSKQEFVFGYSLTKLIQEVSGLQGEEEIFKAYGPGYSPASPWRTPPCYWIWWTKNRCLELDSTFPEQNFSGCINQSDLFYFKNKSGYWCGASPTSTSGGWGHDGESCWRSSLLAPWHFNNLYAETAGSSNQWTMYNAVSTMGVNQPAGQEEGEGDGGYNDVCGDACWGWGHQGCAPYFDHKMGHNQVGTFTAEGWDDFPGSAITPFGIFASYPVGKRSSHNVKYPASTNRERYAAIRNGNAQMVCYKDVSRAGVDPNMPRQCWMADHSVPTWFKEGPNVRPPRSCIDEDGVVMTANGLSPYQRRVAKERSPDIWEIHEFNDTYPVKIKVQEFSEDSPARLYIWGKNSNTFKQKINSKNPFGISVGYTSVSANGNKLAVIRKNTRPEVYRFLDAAGSLEETLPTYQSNIVLALDDTGNFADITDLQGAEALRQNSSSGPYTIFGSRAYPRRNYLKKVRTGYDHTICIRENGTAETSLDEVETTGDRQYYARSVPTVIDYNPSATDYGQKDVPYSPGSKGNSYDWVSHTANGCTQCSGPLFKSAPHIWTPPVVGTNTTPDIIKPCINCDARCAFNDECYKGSQGPCDPPDSDVPPNIKRFCTPGGLGNVGGWCPPSPGGLQPKEPQVPMKPIGSCRFPNTDPDFVRLDCGRPIKNNTPWTQSDYRILAAKPIHNSFPVLDGVDQTYGWGGGFGYWNFIAGRWEYLGPCIVPTVGSFKTYAPGESVSSAQPLAPQPYGKLTCQGKNDRVIFTDQYDLECTTNPTPLCEAGYPPLYCGTVGDVAICGTGGFNDTKHEWFDYMIYTCNRMVIHFDENYCEGIQSWEDISAGGYHNLAINKNSTFVPITDQPNVIETCVPSILDPVYQLGDVYNPNRGTNVVGWGAGDDDDNNSDVCQINNWPNFGQSILPSQLGHCVKVSAGGYHSLAIKNDNKLKAWGAGSVGCPPCTTFNQNNVHFGQSIIPTNLIDVEFIEISAGKFHSCGIRKDNNQVVCWGAGITNQASGGVCGVNWGQSIVPEGLNRCIKVSAGGYHTCVIKETGAIECWGKNTNGQCDIPGSPSSQDIAPQRYIEISCGDEFTAARAQTDIYETFNYYNAHNFLTAPAPTVKDDSSSPYWPVSLFRYFFAFASVEFTYAKGILPAAKGICDQNWTKYLPGAFHQRSDAVHVFAFEMPYYGLFDDNPLVEEDLSEYMTSDFPCQMSYGPALSAFTNHEQGFKKNSIKVDRMFQSQVYWKDRMDCKDWRGEVWDDIQTLGTAIVTTGGQIHPWPEFKTIIEKYTNPSLIKPLGAYRIRGDRFDIRDARGHSAATPNAVTLTKKPPELARMVQSSSRIKIPEEYKDHGVYTLQVNKDIYALNVPDTIYLTPEQLDAYNRLTLSIYFRPKPIGWDNSGPDYLATNDWPTESLRERTILGERSWRYGWLGPRSKTNPSGLTDKYTTNVSVGIGSNNIYAQPGLSQTQGQPFWDTRNRGYIGSSVWEGIQVSALCDLIGQQVAYSSNAHIYVARHLLGIKEIKGGVNSLTSPSILYVPKGARTKAPYHCSLRKAKN